MDIIVFLISLIKQYTKLLFFFFFFNDTATTEIYTLSLHDALPITPAPWPLALWSWPLPGCPRSAGSAIQSPRSEEHTSELQSRGHLVCRLLLEKKKRQRRRLEHREEKIKSIQQG